jgi:hypothetical protein
MIDQIQAGKVLYLIDQCSPLRNSIDEAFT